MAGADNLDDYLWYQSTETDNVQQLHNYCQARPGDVITLGPVGQTAVHHMSIVNKVYPNCDIRVAAHTNDHQTHSVGSMMGGFANWGYKTYRIYRGNLAY